MADLLLNNAGAEVFVPDGTDIDQALERTTLMGIGAHQDDLEIMAYHGIITCFGSGDEWFTGVVMTNGSGSPRDKLYADYTDEQMQEVRRREQKKAAVVGEYSAVAMLDYPSSAIKDPKEDAAVEDLKALLLAAKPRGIYTHNLADKHDTHGGIALRLIQALRELLPQYKPEKLYGCEVWKSLDWMCDDRKVVLPVDKHENLAAALLGIFDSQIAGGKRYDLATMGRRRANATFMASHAVDVSEGTTVAMDLMPLLDDISRDPFEIVREQIDLFANEVKQRLEKLS